MNTEAGWLDVAAWVAPRTHRCTWRTPDARRFWVSGRYRDTVRYGIQTAVAVEQVRYYELTLDMRVAELLDTWGYEMVLPEPVEPNFAGITPPGWDSGYIARWAHNVYRLAPACYSSPRRAARYEYRRPEESDAYRSEALAEVAADLLIETERDNGWLRLTKAFIMEPTPALGPLDGPSLSFLMNNFDVRPTLQQVHHFGRLDEDDRLTLTAELEAIARDGNTSRLYRAPVLMIEED